MKKLFQCILTVSTLALFNPAPAMALTKDTPTSTPAPSAADVEKINVLVTRLNEIDAMDKSNMRSSEKRALRKEVRVIRNEIQHSGGGVYLSVGGLLLIILLLILLF